MKRFVIAGAVVGMIVVGAWADAPETLRARAALALAFAAPGADKPPTYAEQYAKAMRTGLPLVVWVGQPERSLPGCVGLPAETFAGIGAEGVVVGVPTGRHLRRIDLPGRPADADILAAIRSTRNGATQVAVMPAGK